MAAGGALKELCEEASCSICLDLFRDPVILPECGHNFCRACLARSWGEAGAAEASCPQCRRPAQEGSLRPNQQLANFVEILKKCSPAEGKEAEGQGAKGGEAGGSMCGKHGEPLRLFCREDEAPLCLVCGRSREHRGHQVTPLEEAAPQKEQTVVEARKESVCQKHQEPLKLFCKDDEAPICVVCEQSREHRYHEIFPLGEASQEYKDQFCDCVKVLREERDKILAYKDNIVKESQDLLSQTKGERQKTMIIFRQLQKFLEEQEELLLAQMEEAEKEILRRKDRHLDELTGALSFLESIIREMEEKCQQPASDLLQDARSTLKTYEERELFEKIPTTFPLALKWRIWEFSDLNHLWDGIKKQVKDTLDSGFHLQKANVTLDPDTACPRLILSQDQKTVTYGQKWQDLPKNPERFDSQEIVLGREGFTGGRIFWEVVVESEKCRVGVARKSVRRKGFIPFIPKEGVWTTPVSTKTLSGEFKRIQVCLNYFGGRVAFFDADRATLLFEFSGVSFSGETLLPLFQVINSGHLKIPS